MKFFTPELYERFGRARGKRAEEAHSAWKAAEEAYEKRLAQIRRSLPPTVRDLADTFCLKEALLISYQVADTDAVLWLRQGNILYSLHYHLCHAVQILRVRNSTSPVWKEQQPRWLYDEVDLVRFKEFTHAILLSPGYVIEIGFDDFQYSIQEVHPVGTSQSLEAFSRFLPIVDHLQTKRGDARRAKQLSIPMVDVQKMARLARQARHDSRAADRFAKADQVGFLVWPPTAAHHHDSARQVPTTKRVRPSREKRPFAK